jgi:hypothetical protein
MQSSRARLVWRAAAAVCFFLIRGAIPVHASDTRADGGGGGTPFRFECPPDEYLAGVDGRTGNWVDQIRAVCVTSRQLGARGKASGPFFGGPGGISRNIICPLDHAISGWEIQQTRGDITKVGYVKPRCRELFPPHKLFQFTRVWGLVQPKSSAIGAAFGATPVQRDCPEGELAAGIHGAAGLFVDRVGLICKPQPGNKPMRGVGKGTR